MATNNEEIKVEEKINEIITTGKPASVTYQGKKVYIGKNKIVELRDHLDDRREKIGEEKENPSMKVEKEGGLLPLVALLPLIFGGVTAAAAAASGVATVVKNVKEGQLADATKNKIQGSGIYLEPYQGKGLTKYLRTITKGNKDKDCAKEIKEMLKKLGKGELEMRINKKGTGIFLAPYIQKKNE